MSPKSPLSVVRVVSQTDKRANLQPNIPKIIAFERQPNQYFPGSLPCATAQRTAFKPSPEKQRLPGGEGLLGLRVGRNAVIRVGFGGERLFDQLYCSRHLVRRASQLERLETGLACAISCIAQRSNSRVEGICYLTTLQGKNT